MPRRARSILVSLFGALGIFSTVSSSVRGEGLTGVEQRLVARVEANRERAIELLRRAVDQPSATENLDGVRKVGAIFAAELAGLGFETRWVGMPPEVGRAGHLVAEHPAGGAEPKSARGPPSPADRPPRHRARRRAVPARRRSRLRQRRLRHEGRRRGHRRGAAGARRGGAARGPPGDRRADRRRGERRASRTR